MLRKILIISIFVFLSNCSTNPSTALLGPFISGVKSGSVYQASLSYGSGKALEDIKKEIKSKKENASKKSIELVKDIKFSLISLHKSPKPKIKDIEKSEVLRKNLYLKILKLFIIYIFNYYVICEFKESFYFVGW